MQEDIKITDLHFDEHNANLGTDRGRKLLAQSLDQLGAGRSILLDKNNQVIAGNKTSAAAGEVGISDVIVVETDGSKLIAVKRTDLDLETDEKARLLAYADNRTSEVGLQWDTEQLQVDLDAGLDLSGLWNESELALLQFEPTEPEEKKELNTENIDDAPEPEQVEPRCKLGEIWQLGRHRVMCGDSTDEQSVRRLLNGDRKVDMVWSDPPYGINIVNTNVPAGGGERDRTSIDECQERKAKRLGSVGYPKPFGSKNARGSDRASSIVKVNKYFPIAGDDSIDVAINSVEMCSQMFSNAVQVWWGGNYYAHTLLPSSCWIVWDKENTGDFADAELAWTNHKSVVRIFRHQWNGMIKASERGERRVHPTQKPVALAEWCFEKYGNLNDIVFDPFLGSGISVIAAEKMEGSRTVYGMELSPQYCDVTIARWEKLTGNVAQKL